MSGGLAFQKKEGLKRMRLVEKLSAAKFAKAYGIQYASPKTAESTMMVAECFGYRSASTGQ